MVRRAATIKENYDLHYVNTRVKMIDVHYLFIFSSFNFSLEGELKSLDNFSSPSHRKLTVIFSTGACLLYHAIFNKISSHAGNFSHLICWNAI
jgi:hypothetical protein